MFLLAQIGRATQSGEDYSKSFRWSAATTATLRDWQL